MEGLISIIRFLMDKQGITEIEIPMSQLKELETKMIEETVSYENMTITLKAVE